MLKRTPSFLLLLLTLMPMEASRAQERAETIDLLTVDLWPDYDRSSVLVLLTGTLPPDAKLPANVSIPFPEDAQLNAVARIDSKDGAMKDDISSTAGSGDMMFITPDLRFRVEYYLPYTASNSQRSFDFTWLADLSVNNLRLRVQQPLSANSVSTRPAAEKVARDEDGFSYHIFRSRAVKAGDPLSLHVDYQMVADQLSVERPSSGAEVTAPSPSASATRPGLDWLMVAIVSGVLIIVIFFVSRIASRRPSPKVDKLPDRTVDERSRTRFCRHCGSPVNGVDRFCGQCGEGL